MGLKKEGQGGGRVEEGLKKEGQGGGRVEEGRDERDKDKILSDVGNKYVYNVPQDELSPGLSH